MLNKKWQIIIWDFEIDVTVRNNTLFDESYSYALVRSLGLLGNMKSANLILENAPFFSESLEAYSILALRTTAKLHSQNVKKILVWKLLI